jgi:alpha-beta hydrolase superfamily lysophospholipase
MTTRTPRWKSYLKWTFWFVLVQFTLANISASIYAFRLTHFYAAPVPEYGEQNILQKTWKLFVGPKYYRNAKEPLPSFDIENIRLSTSSGIPLDAWYGKADSAKGCVLLFHGNSVNKSYLNHEAALFRSWGYNVLMTDLRAHGKSGGENTTLGVAETEEVLQAFQKAKELGNKRIILYGVSLGAGICIKAVADGLVKPDGLIAEMPFGSLRNHLRGRASHLNFPSEPFATLVTFWIGAKRGYNGFKHNVADYAKKVNCPVLLQWGDQDPFVREDETRRIFNNLQGKDKSLEVYTGAVHESLLDYDPNRWKTVVQEFINRR